MSLKLTVGTLNVLDYDRKYSRVERHDAKEDICILCTGSPEEA